MKLFTRSAALVFSTLFFANAVFAQRTTADTKKALDLVRKNVVTLMLTDDDIGNSYVSDTYTTPEGWTMVYLQQAYKGIPVYNQLQVAAFKNDKIVSLAGSRIGKLEIKVNEPNGMSIISSVQAIQKAASHLRLQPPADVSLLPAANNYDNILHYTPAGVSQHDITAQSLWLPMSDNSVKLCWQVYIAPLYSDDSWMVRVDALTGAILEKDNMTVKCNWDKPASAHAGICSEEVQPAAPSADEEDDGGNATTAVNSANYRVIPFPAESPIHAGGAHAIRTNPWMAAPGNATTLNWQSDSVTEWTITRGNNVHAHLDSSNNNNNAGPADTSSTPLPELSFVQAPDYTQSPKLRINRQLATTNLFYWNNIMHDISYLYGFNEVAGNFQARNLNRGGVANDYVQADAQDGGGTNNANFSLTVDGTSGRMQMYLFNANSSSPNRDGDLDNGVISHEYTHGISGRFTGGPSISTCLNNAEQMGEGWSDYFGLMVTTNWATATTADGPNARPIGNYVLNYAVNGSGIRNYPYSTNMSINPWTYAMMSNTGGEVHNIGEIWCAMLWDMTWNIIQMDGINTNLYNPIGAGGNSIAMKLVTEGMRLQPCRPGFVDGRDAILRADTLLYGARYSCAIWAAFARRGLGTDASQGLSTVYSDGTAGFLSPTGVSDYTYAVDRTQTSSNDIITYVSVLTTGKCGPAVNNYITDTLPTNVTYVSGGTYNAGNRVVTFGPINLAAGASQTFELKVRVNSNAYYAPVTYLTDTVTSATINTATWTPTSTVTAGWTTSTTANRYKSAPYAYFAADPATVSDKLLTTTNYYTINGNSVLSFWHYYSLDAGYDGGVVELTTDSGATWLDLGNYFTLNGYTATIPLIYSSPIIGKRAFSGNSGAVIQSSIDLTAFSGKTIKIRFRLASDNSVSGTGWYVDDIVLKTEPVVTIKTNLFNTTNNPLYSRSTTIPITSGGLPVVWGTFSVQKQGTASLLVWSTLQEANTLSFVIERSSDGSEFSPIAMVAAAGNSTGEQRYMAKDALPLKGTNYYRILQKDKDGKAVYTDIRSLNFDGLSGLISISPNPAKDKIAITLPGNTEKLSAQIVNSSGQAVFAFTINGQYSQQQLPTLAPGVYYLKCISNTQTTVKKLVIE